MLTYLARKSWGAGQGWMAGELCLVPLLSKRLSVAAPAPCPPCGRTLCGAQAHLLLLAVDADQPPLELAAGQPRLDPPLGTLTKVVALVLEIEPILGARVTQGAWGRGGGGSCGGHRDRHVGTVGRVGGSTSPGVALGSGLKADPPQNLPEPRRPLPSLEL